MKVYLFILATLLLCTGTSYSDTAVPQATLPIIIKTAIENNPEIKSSQSRWQMYVGRSKQAGSLEDPMFMLKLQSLLAREPLSFGGSDPQTAKVIGISQQLPFWGKRGLKKEIAQYEAEAYRWSIEERKLELSRMIKEAWYQLWSTEKLLQVLDKNLSVLSDFITIAESKYSVGQGVQQDIFKAGLEKSKMLDTQINLQQKKRGLEATLEYLVYNKQLNLVGSIPDFAIPAINLTQEELNETAYQNRPQIKSLASLAGKGNAAHRLAQKEFYPDFTVSFEYMFREQVATEMVSDPGYNMFSLGVTFNLPLQREKRHAMLAESTSETKMALEELNMLKNNISYTIADSIIQMERRKRQIELYEKGIIPQAEQALESAVINYRVNKVDFLTLLDGVSTLLNYERDLYESQAEYMISLSRLESAVGIDLTVVK